MDPVQSAYRKHHSCETALIKVKNDIDMAIDAGKGALLLLLDNSAAFETINHGILFNRLEKLLGISGVALKWCKSYLSERVQSVLIGSSESTDNIVNIGTAQGSILGSLFYILYILPLGQLISSCGVNNHGFADDRQLYNYFIRKDQSSLTAAISTLEQCYLKVKGWMTLNKLLLNDDKTEFIIIVNKQSILKLRDANGLLPCFHADQNVIQCSQYVRNLGSTFDMCLSMSQMVSKIIQLCYFDLRRIIIVKRFLSAAALKHLIVSLIMSRIDQYNALLTGISKLDKTRLNMALNRAARLLTNTGRREPMTTTLSQLHW